MLSDYNELMAKAKEIIVLRSAQSVLEWDMETMMPPRGINLRSLQLAQMSRVHHRMATDPEIGKLLERIMGHPDFCSLSEAQRRNVHLVKREYDEAVCLPEELVVETARQRAITVDTWKRAKAAKNYRLFRPELEKLVELKKRAAELLMDVKGVPTPYDALVDTFEPGMTSETISMVFDGLRRGLVSIMQRCLSASKQPDISILRRRVPVETQRKVSVLIAEFLGYDVGSERAWGRIDETEHPFTSGYYDDVRITTHYYEDNFASALYSTLHEGGHALYEQNLNPEWIYQPIGAACSLGFHESQSRFMENIIGRSPEFWAYLLPRLKELTGSILSNAALEDFVLAVNRVRPSKIRVEADEVTYCLHVIIRFDIERELIAGRVSVEDLPEIWNRKYEGYLGVEVEDDSEGVMQDTHWASGVYGYFPTYALGNVYSGQLLATMEGEIPMWRARIAVGGFREVKRWLVERVHRRGNMYDPQDLLKGITGEGINTHPYLGYLEDKYSELYGY